jgi:hypothetical protein
MVDIKGNKLVGDGWVYKYEPETRFLEAEHPDRGNQSVAQIVFSGDPDGMGHLIAKLLNIYSKFESISIPGGK